jgi:hypothetical protein
MRMLAGKISLNKVNLPYMVTEYGKLMFYAFSVEVLPEEKYSDYSA